MDLQKQFDEACSIVGDLIIRREELIASVTEAQQNLQENSVQLQQAMNKRDEIRSMMSVVPSKPAKASEDDIMEDRRAVFSALRKIKDTWVAPQAISILSGVESDIASSILLRVSKMDEIPIEHNGKRGRASMYRWVSVK